MAIFDLYSKRQKRLEGEICDFLIYEEIPIKLKNQIIFIIQDCFGYSTERDLHNLPELIFSKIYKILCREYGKPDLGEDYHHSNRTAVVEYFKKTQDIDVLLDIIELVFSQIDTVIKKPELGYPLIIDVACSPDEAIEELNSRFKENEVGYSFEGGEIIRVDSLFMHENVTKSTISLVSNKKFAGVNDEYLKAHEHYLHGRNKECISECLKSFESMLKTICNEKKWSYSDRDAAKRLIEICYENKLIPDYAQNQFTSLRSLLESGIPTIRNRKSGHGQGQAPIEVDDSITRYALNLTGSNIIFLIELSGLK